MGIEHTECEEELLKTFEFEGNSQPIDFVETVPVNTGVECDVYAFVQDDSKDLGIIRINPGYKTPLQRVLKGQRTIEGYISGEGQLTIIRSGGNNEVYQVGNQTQEKLAIDINIGDLMQWQAKGSSRLIAYEICIPPYQDGRYENIG